MMKTRRISFVFALTALTAWTVALSRSGVAQRGRAPAGETQRAEAAPGASVFPNPPRTERLPNGLTVISLPTEAPGIVAYYTLVRVGARDEVEEGHSGFAHLFEHMMFRGTEAYPQQRYEATIQSFGADNNAYTTQDFTLYTVVVPRAALGRLVEIEADRFQNLQYDESVFRTETGAVRGEYDTSASNPSRKMWESLSEISFTRHTYGHTTLGYLRDIETMPEKYDYSRRFFQRFYTPDNTTIIVAGDVDHDALMREVRRHYGRWRGRRDQPRIPVEPEPRAGERRHIDWPSPAAQRMLVGWRTPAFVQGRSEAERRRSLRDTAALRVVHGLAFSEPSPLYQRLVVQERSLLQLHSWADELSRDPHLFVVQATLADGSSFDASIDALQRELDTLAAGEIDSARVEAVKSHVHYALLTAMQTPSDVADVAARFIAAGGRLGAIDDFMEALATVTPEDVARVAREYLNENRRFVVTLAHGPAEEGREVGEGEGAR